MRAEELTSLRSEPQEEPQRAPAPSPSRVVVRLEDIAAADDLQIEWAPIPEWAPRGDPDPSRYGVFVRALNGRERAQWQQASLMGRGKDTTINFQQSTMKLIQAACVDEDGKRVFDDGALKILEKKNSAVIERLYDLATRLSGIGDEEVDDLTGKGSATSEDSTSD